MLIPPIFDDLAASLSRVPSHPGQVVKVTRRSTKERMWLYIESTSLDSIDFWMVGVSPE